MQIKATPANNRFKDVFATESQPLHLNHLFEEDGPPIPSSASVVPASTLPRKFTNVFATSTTPNIGANPSSEGGGNEAAQLPPRKQMQETPLRKKSVPHISLPQIDEEVEEATPVPPKNKEPHIQATPMRKQQRFTQQKLPVPRPEGHLQVQATTTTPQRKRAIQGTPMRKKSLQSLPQIVEEEDDPLTHSIPSSSPIFAKRLTIASPFNRAAKQQQQQQQQQQYLVPPTPLGNRSGNEGAAAMTTAADSPPSSPGFAFFETPLNNAKTKTAMSTTAGGGVVDDTPIKFRLPSAFTSMTTGAGGSENNGPFGSSSSSSRRASSGGGGVGGVTKIKKEKDNSPVSIYQHLGWDDTDDDLA